MRIIKGNVWLNHIHILINFPYPKMMIVKSIMIYMVWLLVSGSGLASEDTIDVAYLGGAFLMERSVVEKDMLEQIWTNVIRTSGIRNNDVEVSLRNFVNENELYKVMKKKRFLAR